MISSEGMPAFTSSSINISTSWWAFLMPTSSSFPAGSSDRRSNQEGIWKPELSVTGILLAVGQITFT